MAMSAGDAPMAALPGLVQFAAEQSSGHEGTHEQHHEHALEFPFLFASLALGAMTLQVQSRFLPSVPYTCLLLMEGVLFGYMVERPHVSLLGQSANLWAKIDPHLLLYVFLPALIFADSMFLNWHMWKRCFGQCLLLAGPGVVIGSLLQAAVAKYIFSYNWSWYECIMFGSILGATDPVAVVSILKEVGAPPALTMMVSGESLLNDGTAVVIFNLFAALAHNTPEALGDVGIPPDGGLDVYAVLKYFLFMAGGGALLGIVIGCVAVFWIGLAKRKTSHSDSNIQLTIVICLPYIAFILGEQYCGVSGILSVVSAGLVVAACGMPQFASRRVLENVWHVIEYILNTLIFLLAGVIIGDALAEDTQKPYESWHLSFEDLRLLAINFVLTVVIRFLMIAMLFPVLSRMGYGLSGRDFVMLSWGGLRGAVGLALALDVDISFADAPREDQIMGRRVLFHVSGIAVLSLLVNGTLTAPLLNLLGMSKSDQYAEALLKDINSRIHARCQEAFDQHATQLGDLCSEDIRLEVKRKCRSLQRARAPSSLPTLSRVSKVSPDQDGKLIAVRKLFLKVLQSEFRAQQESGVTGYNGQVAIILDCGVEAALDRVRLGLFDFEAVWERCSSHPFLARVVRWSDANLRESWALFFGDLVANAGLCIRDYTVGYLLSCFIQAHLRTQTKIAYLIGESEGMDSFKEEQVINESQEEVKMAQNALRNMDARLERQVVVGQLSNVVLECERRQIMLFVEEGVLDDKQAHHLFEETEVQAAGLYKSERRATIVQPGGIGTFLEMSSSGPRESATSWSCPTRSSDGAISTQTVPQNAQSAPLAHDVTLQMPPDNVPV